MADNRLHKRVHTLKILRRLLSAPDPKRFRVLPIALKIERASHPTRRLILRLGGTISTCIVPVQYFVEIDLKTSLFSKGHCESPRASLHSYLDMCLSRDKPYSMKPTFMIWYVPYSMCLSKRQNKRGSWLFAGARDKIWEN